MTGFTLADPDKGAKLTFAPKFLIGYINIFEHFVTFKPKLQDKHFLILNLYLP